MLKIENLEVCYGGIRALQGVSLHVAQGEIVTLIGANGAGKTTLLKTVSGILRPKSGIIRFTRDGGEVLLNRLAPHDIVAQGISQVPEGRMIFSNLSVLENIELGAHLRKDSLEIARDFERIYRLFPRLKERLAQNAGTLSGGEQQMLAIARALAARPRLILMDEPSLGLAPIMVKGIFETIREINEHGLALLLVEQNAHMALKVAHRAYVMETGRIVLQGATAELEGNEAVKKAYLGG